jgi:hypothetical protein
MPNWPKPFMKTSPNRAIGTIILLIPKKFGMYDFENPLKKFPIEENIDPKKFVIPEKKALINFIFCTLIYIFILMFLMSIVF